MSACFKKETLLEFVDREMAPDEMELAEKHIAACSSCQRQLESVRWTSLKVNALLNLLAPVESPDEQRAAVIAIPYKAAKVGIRWAVVASVGVLLAAVTLFAIIRRSHTETTPNLAKTSAPAPAPAVEKKESYVATVTKPADVVTPKNPAKVRRFRALDDGAPIQTGMIFRVSLRGRKSPDASASQVARRVPAEVIVDEFGKVRAIRFLQ